MGVGGWDDTTPPKQIFEKLVNKNAIIKPKIGGPLAIFPESLGPQVFRKKFELPRPPPLDFIARCIYDFEFCQYQGMIRFLKSDSEHFSATIVVRLGIKLKRIDVDQKVLQDFWNQKYEPVTILLKWFGATFSHFEKNSLCFF